MSNTTRRSVYIDEGVRAVEAEDGTFKIEFDEELELELTTEKVMEMMFNRLWKVEQKVAFAVEVLHRSA